MADTEPSTRSQLDALQQALTAALPQILDVVESRLESVSPVYAGFLSENRLELTASAATAMSLLVARVEQQLTDPDRLDAAGPGVAQALFEQVGRTQRRQGLGLTTLLSAYQIGARTAWRQMSAVALEEGVAPTALVALAESLFFLIDQLSSASTRGYLAEQTEEGASREHLRDELADLLLSDRSSSAAVREAASRAGWRLPLTAAVVWMAPGADGRTRLARLDPDVLLVRNATLPGAIVPDPDGPGRHIRMVEALGGSAAVIGRAVPLGTLAASAYIAEIAAQLQCTGVLGTGPIFVDDHLDTVIVHRDPRLVRALQQQCLEPLARATPASRELLRQTLRAWLLHLGDRRLMAAELRIHPQTARYRMARLTDLFGPALDDPNFRRRLMLAVLWDSD